jgi:hypothetical protein
MRYSDNIRWIRVCVFELGSFHESGLNNSMLHAGVVVYQTAHGLTESFTEIALFGTKKIEFLRRFCPFKMARRLTTIWATSWPFSEGAICHGCQREIAQKIGVPEPFRLLFGSKKFDILA